MTPYPTPAPQTITISSADDLTTLWAALLGDGGFSRRTLWLAVLDDAGRPTPVLLPIDDVPAAPTTADVDALRTLLTGMAEFGTVVMLIARPGHLAAQEDDRRWAQALTPLSPGWPICLAAADDDGRATVRPLSDVRDLCAPPGPVTN